MKLLPSSMIPAEYLLRLRARFLGLGWLFIIAGISLVGGLAVSASAQEADPLHWMEVLSPSETERLESGSTRVGDALFDMVDDLTLLRAELWDSGSTVRLRSQRKVFDNQDVLNSWTVVDRVRIEAGLPISTLSVAGTPLSLKLGTQHALDFVNIRQVLPEAYSSLPTSREREREIVSAVDGALSRKPPAPPVGSPPDPQDSARFGRPFERLLFPMRLNRMEPGEIIAYAAEGAIELGAGVGWRLEGDLLGSVGAGLSVTTFVQGVFRISVLRESDTVARVKVTRLGGVGHRWLVGATLDPRIVSGLLVFRPSRVVDQIFKVTPFELSTQKMRTRSFDVGYRYDLTVPSAREAYEQALIGRFAFSEEASGVTRVFTRDGEGTSEDLSTRMRLGVIVGRTNNGSHQSLETTIQQPDGKVHVFQAWSENSLELSAFWLNYEKFRHRFLVQFDPARESSLQLWVEAEIQDSRTSPSEIQAYILEVEDAVGIPWIFPRLPARGGERSSFFYRMAFSVEQLEAFAGVSPEMAWSHLEKAFGVPSGSWDSAWKRFWHRLKGDSLALLTFPLYVVDLPLRNGTMLARAARIHDRWMAIRGSESSRDAAKRLAKLFDDRWFGVELVRLLRGVLDQQTVAFQVTGYSPAFGRVSREGNSTLFEQDIATRAQREVDFDKEGGRIPDLDRLSWVDELGVRVETATRVRVDFSLRTRPRAVFVELLEDSGWLTRPKRVGSLLLENGNQFIAGRNQIVLNSEESDSPYYAISKSLKPNQSYRLRVASNPEGLRWGPVATAEFRTPQR
jgi:hypothetical protein